jgi:MauM/NapG family ferredoxin protein
MNLRDALLRLLTAAASSEVPLRPPGAVREADFLRRCIKCNKCAQVCPYNSVRMGRLQDGARYGTPQIRPRAMPCYLCMKCPPVCPTGALDARVLHKEQVRMGVAVIDTEACLAYHNIICRACFERCLLYREAVTLRDEHFPEVHADACTGCGVCENVCLTDPPAIRVQSYHDVRRQEEVPAVPRRPADGRGEP